MEFVVALSSTNATKKKNFNPNKPLFLRVCGTNPLKIVREGEISTHLETLPPFSPDLEIMVCKLVQFRRV